MKKISRLTYLVILLFLCACKSKKEKQITPTYTATTPFVEDVSLPQSYVGNIASLRNVEIRSQQEGILQDMYVSEGQFVRAGQPLFRIAIIGVDEEIAKTQKKIPHKQKEKK